MAIVPMQKVAVLSERRMREDVLDVLQKKGVLQVADAPEAPKVDHTEVNFKLAELQFAIDTLKDKAAKQTLQALQRPATQEQVLSAVQETDVRGMVDRLHSLEEEDTALRRSQEELAQRSALLSPWRALPDRLDAQANTFHAVRLCGTVPAGALPALQDLQKDASLKVAVDVVDAASGTVAATVWKGDRDAFEERATALGWTTVSLPRLEGTAASVLEADAVESRRVADQLRKNAAERVRLSAELPSLMRVQTFMRWLGDKQAVRESLVEGFATSTLLGWVPKAQVSALEHALAKVSPSVAVLKVKPDEGEEAPVALKNSPFITPFESVTTLYGLPLPSEMDPTAPLSPFFALYFALCLTDGGYGFVLALLFGAFLLVKRPTPKEATLPWLLFISGIASVLVGIPFGGWFGLTPAQVPEFLTVARPDGTRWFLGQLWNLSTQDGITFLQNLSLVLGITHIFFGVFLAGWYKWLHASKSEAFWVHFTSHLLLGGALFYAFAPAGAEQIALWLLYASLALNIWGKGYGSVWYVRPIMGVLGLVNFGIGLLSNGLSYLRILALGLVTGAIALAVNQVAIQMGQLFPPVIGIPMVMLIALAGHLVSIALNTLGAFIHSGRLQFIEFFGQFFEGGGRPYTPFKRSIS